MQDDYYDRFSAPVGLIWVPFTQCKTCRWRDESHGKYRCKQYMTSAGIPDGIAMDKTPCPHYAQD
jgi:hypothetical protein